MRSALAVASLAAVLATVTVHAKPDFSRSTITARTPITEGDVVVFTVAVSNTGDSDAPGTQVQFDLPGEAMLVDVSGLPGAHVDRTDRIVTAQIDLAAASEQRFDVRMVVPRDRGGNLLMPDLRVHALYLGADHNSGAEFPIESRADTSGLAVGGIRFNTPSLVLVGVLISYPFLWLLFYSRTRSHGPLVAMVIAIGFLAIFAALAWRDWQTLTTWRETTCTIVDSRLRPESSAPLAVEPVTRRRRGTENVHQTLLALRYDVNGRETISTGFDTGSRLSVGGIAAAIEEYSRWPIGAAVPCRYDPGDVGDVVVVPGFGGAYLFALFPLMLLVFGVAAIRRPRAWR